MQGMAHVWAWSACYLCCLGAWSYVGVVWGRGLCVALVIYMGMWVGSQNFFREIQSRCPFVSQY